MLGIIFGFIVLFIGIAACAYAVLQISLVNRAYRESEKRSRKFEAEMLTWKQHVQSLPESEVAEIMRKLVARIDADRSAGQQVFIVNREEFNWRVKEKLEDHYEKDGIWFDFYSEWKIRFDCKPSSSLGNSKDAEEDAATATIIALTTCGG